MNTKELKQLQEIKSDLFEVCRKLNELMLPDNPENNDSLYELVDLNWAWQLTRLAKDIVSKRVGEAKHQWLLDQVKNK